MYKLKHIPTGLYYQPHKHRGSNISKRGKVYQTSTHGLSSAFRSAEKHPTDAQCQLFYIYVEKDSIIHRQYKEAFVWEEIRGSYSQVKAETNVSDWVVENILEIKRIERITVAVFCRDVEDFQYFVNRFLQDNGIYFKNLTNRKIQTDTATYHCITDPMHYRGMSPDKVVETPSAYKNNKYCDLIEIAKVNLPKGQKFESEL